MNRFLLIFAVLFGFCPAASAEDFPCIGTIDRVLVYSSGQVNVRTSWRDNFTMICDLSKDRQDVSVVTCAMWASLVQNAKENSSEVVFYYRSDETFDSCENIPIYANAPAPVYVGLR